MKARVINVHEQGAYDFLLKMLGAPTRVLPNIGRWMVVIHGAKLFKQANIEEVEAAPMPDWARLSWVYESDGYAHAVLRCTSKAPLTVQVFQEILPEDARRLHGTGSLSRLGCVNCLWPAWQLGEFKPRYSMPEASGFCLAPIGGGWF